MQPPETRPRPGRVQPPARVLAEEPSGLEPGPRPAERLQERLQALPACRHRR